MDPLHLELARFLAAQGVARDERILVAVSGGADSVALLHGLVSIGQLVAAGHVHHGLRAAAAEADLEFVAALAGKLGLPFDAVRVQAARQDGRSPEARARELRYGALAELRVRLGCAWIATAHSLDDQAETVLLRAVRGTGLRGLAGIAPLRQERRLLRPLLGLRRQALRDYLCARGLGWREDETNRDLSIPRNRVRAQILPGLEEVHEGATAKLARLAELARGSMAEGRGRLVAALERAVRAGDGGLWLEPRELATLAPSERRHALARLLERAGLGERVTTLHLQRMDVFLAPEGGPSSLSLPGRHLLVRDGGRVWLGELPGPRFPAPVCALAEPPAPLEFPERGVRLSWRQKSPHASQYDELYLPLEPRPKLRVRSPVPGDRIALSGRSGSRELSQLFSAAGWSRSARARALVVESDGRPVWVPGLTPAARPARPAASAWCLAFERLSTTPES